MRICEREGCPEPHSTVGARLLGTGGGFPCGDCLELLDNDHGHPSTKRARRARNVERAAEAAGLSVEDYRAERRKSAAWAKSPLNPWSSRAPSYYPDPRFR